MLRALTLAPAYFAAAFVATVAVNWLAAWKWRCATNAHWTERARLLCPVRTSAAVNIVVLPFYCGLLQFCFDRAFSVACIGALVSTWFGAVFGTYPLDREIQPAMNFTAWLRLVTLAWSFKLIYWTVWLGGALIMPNTVDWRAFAIGGLVLVFQMAMNYGLWLRILTWLGILGPADERLRAIVANTSESMQVTMPRTWLHNVPLANAFALITTHELIFTTGLMKSCNDEEVSAICAHELAHLTESKKVRILRIVGSLILFPFLFVKPSLHILDGAGILLVLLGFVVLWLLQRKIGRRMETRADTKAAEQHNTDGVYARALEKLYRENQMPAVNQSNRVIHPHLYDRMLTAGIQPDFERPKPPDAATWVHGVFVLVLVILVNFAMKRR